MIGHGKNGIFGRTVAGLLLISFLMSSCVTPNQVALTSGVSEVQLVPLDAAGKPITLGKVFIEEIVPGSPAEEAGLRPQEQILEIGGEIPLTAAHARSLLSDKEEISLRVLASDGMERTVPLVRRGIFGLYFKAEDPSVNIVDAKGYSTEVLVTHSDYRPFKETLKPTVDPSRESHRHSGRIGLVVGSLIIITSFFLNGMMQPTEVYNNETGTWEEDPDYIEPNEIFVPIGLGFGAIGSLFLAYGYSKSYPKTYEIPMDHFARNALYDGQGYNLATGLDRYGITKDGVYPDGSRFDGKLVAGKREGYGTMVGPDGKFAAAGFFADDTLNGLAKELDLTDPDQPRLTFLGYFQDGRRSGAGIEFNGNGKPAFLVSSSQGSEQARVPYPAQPLKESADLLFLGAGFAKGLAEGKGAALRVDGGVSQEGIFRNGELVEGHKRLADGTIMQGTFEQGFLVRGSVRRSDGSGAEGTWKNGRLQSPGKIVFADGRAYTGSFDSESIRTGEGTMSYPNGAQYAGSIANQVPHGQGKLKTSDGTVYEGSFVNGNAQGEGKLTYANGESYEGSFSGGVPHGTGIYRSEIAVERAEYVDGHRVDQVYLMRLERERIAEEQRSREERQRAEELAAERERLEEQRRQKEEQRLAEERQRDAQFKKEALSLLGGLAVTGFAGSKGIDDDLALDLGAATAKDIYEGSTTNLDALKAKTEAETARAGRTTQTSSTQQQQAPRMAVAPAVIPGLVPAAPTDGGAAAAKSPNSAPVGSGPAAGSAQAAGPQKPERRPTPLSYKGQSNNEVTIDIAAMRRAVGVPAARFFNVYKCTAGFDSTSRIELKANGKGVGTINNSGMGGKYSTPIEFEWGIQLTKEGDIAISEKYGKKGMGLILIYTQPKDFRDGADLLTLYGDNTEVAFFGDGMMFQAP